MGKRGPKSTVSLAVVPGGAVAYMPQRPEPPKELSREGKVAWRSYVARMPADWFTDETLPMLLELCRSVVKSARFEAELEELTGRSKGLAKRLREEEPDLSPRLMNQRIQIHYDRIYDLNKLQQDQARMIATMSTKLRLTPQSRFDRKVAARVANEEPPAPRKKLWER